MADLENENKEGKQPDSNDNKADDSVKKLNDGANTSEDHDDEDDDDSSGFDREPKALSSKEKDYFRQLREENKKHREKAKKTELKYKEAQDKIHDIASKFSEAEKKAQLADEKVEKFLKLSEQRLINAELREQAQKAGAIDFDVLKKVIDISSVKIDDNGDLIGIDQAVSALKVKSPFLFKEHKNTTLPIRPPRPADPNGVDVSKLKRDEYLKKKSELLRKVSS